MTQTNSNHKVGRLVIVDDESELLTTLCEILTDHGYETVGYTSGAEALAKLKEQDFDLLLTDLMMPEMDGIELLQAALKIDPDIVGIVMTGQGTVQTAVEAMKIGAFDYIMKPFNLNSLIPVLSRAMEVHHLRAENMQLRETVAMHELGQALAFSSDLNQILNKVTDAVMQQCDADEASIMLPTSDGKDLIVAVARGGHTEHIGKQIPMGQGIAGWVAQNRETVTLSGEVHDERFTLINPRADIRAAVSFPLLTRSNLVGVLNVNIIHSHRPFTLGQIKTLNMLATIVSPILENVRLYAEKKRAEDLYRTLAEASLAVVFIVQDGKFRFINAAVKSVGYSVEEMTGLNADAIIHPEDREMVKKMGREMLRGEHTTPYEYRMVNKQGEIRCLLQIVSPILYEDKPAILGNATDISELKKAEEALRIQARTFSEVLNSLDALVYVIDMNTYEILLINAYGQNICGDIKGKICWQTIHKGKVGPCEFCTNSQLIGPDGNPTKGVVWEFQNTVTTRWYDCRDKAIYWPDGRIVRVEIATDITERKQAEEALRESEEKYRAIIENMQEGYHEVDINGNFTFFNESMRKIIGYEREELLGMNNRQYSDEENARKVYQVYNSVYRTGDPVKNLEWQIIRKDGERRDIEVSISRITNGDGSPTGFRGIVRDTSERKRAEESLRQAEERYRSIFENAQEGIFRSTPDGKIIMSNPALAKIYRYESPEELMTSITDLASQHYVNPEDRRELKEVIKEHGVIKGYEAQHYRKDGSIIWVSMTMHAVRDEKGQIMYYDGITEDITNHKQAVERTRKALGATVQAIAVIVETRDPYTAGHQRRVADLSVAIATEMNLPIDMIDGVRIAAAIHDLGKISVPAEILSKPIKLTDIESSLIKTHSQSGYDILKDIDFPWPVARTVLEHHERMNGSGYPNGLTEDNILTESRILSVADVVEAMASHRPYRPSLGIEAALEEIEKNKGIHYDNTVADACLRLFREKGYQLERT